MHTVHIDSLWEYPSISFCMVVGFIWARGQYHIVDFVMQRGFEVEFPSGVEEAASGIDSLFLFRFLFLSCFPSFLESKNMSAAAHSMLARVMM